MKISREGFRDIENKQCRSIPREDGFRMPGEFEKHDATIMIWPVRPGSWIKNAGPAREAFTQVIRAIAEHETVYLATSCMSRDSAEMIFRDDENVILMNIESSDAWARDVGPTFVTNSNGVIRGINWEFNAWGGSYNGLYTDYADDNAFAKNFCDKTGYDMYDASPFVCEGGSIHSDGEGTLLVTESCLLSPGRNPQLSKTEIEDILCEYLGARKVLWIPRGIFMDETDEHVDNICAFIRPGEVILSWTDNEKDPQYELSMESYQYLCGQTDACGRQIIIHKMPIPRKPVCLTKEEVEAYVYEPGEGERCVGERMAASYVNFYFCNDSVILPQFCGDNKESDILAADIMQRLCPDRRIVLVPARSILLGGGNIHCITQQVPTGAR